MQDLKKKTKPMKKFSVSTEGRSKESSEGMASSNIWHANKWWPCKTDLLISISMTSHHKACDFVRVVMIHDHDPNVLLFQTKY